MSAAPTAVANMMGSALATAATAMSVPPAMVTTTMTAVFTHRAMSEPMLVTHSHHIAMPHLVCAYHVDINGNLNVFTCTCTLCQCWSPDNAMFLQSLASAGHLAMTCFRRTHHWPDSAMHHYSDNFRVISTLTLTLFQKGGSELRYFKKGGLSRLNLPQMAIITTSSHGHGFSIKII